MMVIAELTIVNPGYDEYFKTHIHIWSQVI